MAGLYEVIPEVSTVKWLDSEGNLRTDGWTIPDEPEDEQDSSDLTTQ